MAASIHLNLNALFAGNLSREDAENTSATIEDYFCFNSGDEYEFDTDDVDPLEIEQEDVQDSEDETERDPLNLDDPIVPAIDPRVAFEMRKEDERECEVITQFLTDGCKCPTNCSTKFTRHYYEYLRCQCAELTHEVLDMVIMGQLMAFARPENKIFQYLHIGEKVCRDTYMFLHGVGKKRLAAIRSSLRINGLEPRVHGNKHKQPHNAFSVEDVKMVVKYLTNHAEDNAILLPGRIPGYHRWDLKLLPSNTTKLAIWEAYSLNMDTTSNNRKVGYRSFRNIWSKYLPEIIITKPMSDLCWTCQKNNSLIMRSVNKSEEDKSKTLKLAEKHLLAVTKERSNFRCVVKDSTDAVKEFFTTNDVFTPPPIHCCLPPLTNNITVHYSFDFAQQVHYPADPHQPGPIYFLTPRKCGIFGVCCEAIPRQINYLIDEAVDIGKGANTVVSLIHHFFDTHSLGEKHVHLHADNCVGQNKNNTMIHYLMWRVMKGLHESITISFMLVGHTKFSPDWCFGLMKRKFRKTKVDSLDDLVGVVNVSATVNESQLVGSQSGEPIVPMYDWVGFFGSRLKKIPLITRQQHFQFTSSNKGTVKVREYSDSSVIDYKLTSDVTLAVEFPDTIIPPGMSLQRQWYLHDKIGDFCSIDTRDVVCPRPETPLPTRSTPQPPSPPSVSISSHSGTQPNPKGGRVCGGCGETGHNKRTCSKLRTPVEDIPSSSVPSTRRNH